MGKPCSRESGWQVGCQRIACLNQWVVTDTEPLLVEQSSGIFSRVVIASSYVCPHRSCNSDHTGTATRCESEPVTGLCKPFSSVIRQHSSVFVSIRQLV